MPGLLLVWSSGRAALTPLPLGKEPLVLGRGKVGEVEIDDACMSRRHAEVSCAGGVWAVRDLDSRNGSALDGRPLHGEQKTAKARLLRTGDTLLLLCADLREYTGADVERREGVVVGPTLRRAWNEIDDIARTCEVLHIRGETGSGKELAARRFHAQGPRPTGPFIAVNCASVPVNLAERLLFGAKRGAYSGATEDSDGYIQAADGGTLFLDEVAELDQAVQAKLLRVLESHEVMQLGASKSRRVNLRLCSATHGQLRDRVDQGGFRQDLFFRMGRPDVRLPALRERAEDIPWLIEELVARPLRAHVSLVEAALGRPWPGNLRELALEVREAARAAAAKGSEQVEADHLDARAGSTKEAQAEEPAAPQLDRAAVEAALARHDGNVSQTARALGLHRNQLRRLIERYGISNETDK